MAKRYKENKTVKMLYVFFVALTLTLVIFLTIFVMYSKNLKSESKRNLERLSSMNAIVPNDDLETSYSQDKGIEEAKTAIVENKEVKKKINKEVVNKVVEDTSNQEVNKVPEEKVEEKEPEFAAPVSGEIIKDFAKDTLLYSNTLAEWCTHPGIDIKGEKTSIVLASEAGKVVSIDNDSRYGLCVTIEHSCGFKTVYSNLCTSEFVKEGDVVEKGQTIGTIGDTASFESADESHLHFEMYKDGELVNPTIYLK